MKLLKNGIPSDFHLDKILDIVKLNVDTGATYFVISRKGEQHNEQYLVDRYYANKKWPQEVIEYYQNIIKWDVKSAKE